MTRLWNGSRRCGARHWRETRQSAPKLLVSGPKGLLERPEVNGLFNFFDVVVKEGIELYVLKLGSKAPFRRLLLPIAK